MPGWARVSYIFRSAPAGTPPFVTGLWFLAPAGADDESVTGLLAMARDAWNNNIGPITSSDLDAPVVFGHYEDETHVFEDEVTCNEPSGGSGYRGPGSSYRAVFGGSRPPGGRPNQCYFPWPPAAEVGANGAVSAPSRAAIVDWADEIIEETEPLLFQWRNRHFLGTEDASSSMVTGAVCAATASWLQRRYR